MPEDLSDLDDRALHHRDQDGACCQPTSVPGTAFHGQTLRRTHRPNAVGDQHNLQRNVASWRERAKQRARSSRVGNATWRSATRSPRERFSLPRVGRLWRTDLNGDREPEILVEYEAKSGDDRYAAFFAFQWKGTTYHVTAASWFLEGSLHAVQPFGPQAKMTVFLRFVSCTECHPWVYLTALDFLMQPVGEAFAFSYSTTAKKSWAPEIEYKLPGRGHSIDAKVETRLPVSPLPRRPAHASAF